MSDLQKLRCLSLLPLRHLHLLLYNLRHSLSRLFNSLWLNRRHLFKLSLRLHSLLLHSLLMWKYPQHLKVLLIYDDIPDSFELPGMSLFVLVFFFKK